MNTAKSTTTEVVERLERDHAAAATPPACSAAKARTNRSARMRSAAVERSSSPPGLVEESRGAERVAAAHPDDRLRREVDARCGPRARGALARLRDPAVGRVEVTDERIAERDQGGDHRSKGLRTAPLRRRKGVERAANVTEPQQRQPE